MKYTYLLPFMFVVLLITLACGMNFSSPQIVEGSGVMESQERSLREFSAIEIASFGDVYLTIGEAQKVVVETDDNILPLVETIVDGEKLVIRTKPFTDINPKLPVRVIVTVKSIQAAEITGSGNITITGLDAESIRFDLTGSGNITVTGRAQQEIVSLKGSGNILCGDLEAQSVTVDLGGSGDITVFASERLDATISGSGNVHYRGDPAQVNQSVPGSGNVDPIP